TAPPAHFRAAWPLLLAVTGRPGAAAAIDEIEECGLSVNCGVRGWLVMCRAVLVGRTDRPQAAALAVGADGQLDSLPMWRHLARRLAGEAARADGWALPDGWLADAEDWFDGHSYPAAGAACRRLLRARPATVPVAWARFGITA